MHPFQAIMIVCIAAFLMIAALFIMIWKIPRTNLGIIWWIIASTSLACSYLLSFIFFNSTNSLINDLVFYFLTMTSSLATYIGCMRFMNHIIRCIITITIFVLTSFTLTALRLLDFLFLSELIFAAYCSVSFGLAAWYFQQKRDELHYIKRVLALFLFLISLHFLSFPWMGNIVWFVPIHFLISLLLHVTTYCLLASLIILQFKLHITESKHRATHAAMHDSLTGLLNRHALQQTFLTWNYPSFSLLYLDLDGFKYINDTYGHKAGDEVLVQIAQRLREQTPDTAKIARVGGDEFIILLPYEQKADIQTFTKQLLKCIETPIQCSCKNQIYSVSASIGISLYPQNGNNLSDLIGAADHAMYKAKHSGANDFRLATNFT